MGCRENGFGVKNCEEHDVGGKVDALGPSIFLTKGEDRNYSSWWAVTDGRTITLRKQYRYLSFPFWYSYRPLSYFNFASQLHKKILNNPIMCFASYYFSMQRVNRHIAATSAYSIIELWYLASPLYFYNQFFAVLIVWHYRSSYIYYYYAMRPKIIELPFNYKYWKTDWKYNCYFNIERGKERRKKRNKYTVMKNCLILKIKHNIIHVYNIN